MRKDVAIPTAKMSGANIQLESANCNTPLIVWPLVHPCLIDFLARAIDTAERAEVGYRVPRGKTEIFTELHLLFGFEGLDRNADRGDLDKGGGPIIPWYCWIFHRHGVRGGLKLNQKIEVRFLLIQVCGHC